MILEAKSLTKTFAFPQKVEVLSQLDFQIDQGESAAITGRSGEGKTTLLHILGTLEAPDSGHLAILGEQVTSSNRAALRSKHIGFIFQSYNLLEDFTSLENVLMPAKIARSSSDRQKGLSLLDRVGLLDRAHFPVKLLSGGERQRVAIARALCNDPEILLADEPSGNLDQATGKEIATLLLELVKERKKSLILVTHDRELAQLCSKQYRLFSGKLSPL